MEYKQVKFRLSSWNKLRRAFYGRKDETLSDYIERIAKFRKNKQYINKLAGDKLK
jgi:hypothetical protein